jgi:hypothetical protein
MLSNSLIAVRLKPESYTGRARALKPGTNPSASFSALLGSTETTVLGRNVRIDGALEFTERYADIAPYEYNVLGKEKALIRPSCKMPYNTA